MSDNASYSSSDVEIIEDSEPERQERLAKLRLARKQSQKARTSVDIGPAQTSQVTTSTQISVPAASSEPASAVSIGAPPKEKGEGRPAAPLAKSSSLPVRKPAPPPWLASNTTSTPTDPPADSSSPTRPISLKLSSQPSPVKQLDLNSFAFQKRTVGRSASYSTSSRSVSGSKDKDKEAFAVESCSDAPKASASTTKSSSLPKVFILGATKECPTTEASFTAEQINSLRSCVVCGNAWTARKTPKNKWAHIMSCARKGGCDLDTLYIKLIGAVVDASDAKGKKPAKSKAKEKEKQQTGPRSLFTHTIQERAPPKKRGRRVEPGSTILQPVGETHRVILERGAALLGVAPVLDVECHSGVVAGTPTEDELVEEKQEASEEEPNIPATQSFAPSKMGGRSRLFGSTLATMNMDSRSGLFYADLPCDILPTSTTRSLSTFEPPPTSNLSCSPVFLTIPRSAPPISSSDSSIISISSSNDSNSDPGVDNLDDRIPSPVRSDSSASVIILDSTHSFISRRAPTSPLSPTDSHASFHPPSRRQSFGEEWNSQEGVYMWEGYNPSRQPSPTSSLADYIHEMSLRENEGIRELPRGRSRSPRLFSKSRSRSRGPSRSKSPPKRSGGNRKRSKSRSGSRQRTKSKPASKKGKTKGRSKSKSRSRSRSKSRIASPKPRKRRTVRRGSMYAPEDNEGAARTKNLDVKLLNLILRDKELHLRILRYEPIKFEDILNVALEDGIPKHGLSVKLKAFLDSQCINFYTAEALGRKKTRHA